MAFLKTKKNVTIKFSKISNVKGEVINPLTIVVITCVGYELYTYIPIVSSLHHERCSIA